MIITLLLCMISVMHCQLISLTEDQVIFLNFNDRKGVNSEHGENIQFVDGLDQLALKLDADSFYPMNSDSCLSLLSNKHDFSINVWIKSSHSSHDTSLILSNAVFSNKEVPYYGPRRVNNGLSFYNCNGSWGWNLGNGEQHFIYEPLDTDQPINDNEWHMLTFTHNAAQSEVRLFYDGINKATIHIGDMVKQDFYSKLPLCIGSNSFNNDEYSTFCGAIEDLSVWNKILSPSMVQKEYAKYRKVDEAPVLNSNTIKVLNWNIWHGGTHYSNEKDGFDGINRTVELIQEAEADIVLMQETYGAGSQISSQLGYYYYEAGSCIGAVWGANLSVMSRFPIQEVYMIEEKSNYGKNYAFNNGGAKIRLNDDEQIIVFSNWYNGNKPDDVEGTLSAWENLIDNTDSIPVIFGGDYNAISHLDDKLEGSEHSRLMVNAGFIDSFRHLYPNVETHPGYTFNTSKRRIDYIYFKGTSLTVKEVKPIVSNFKGKGKLTPGYPSDHLGLVATFKLNSY